MKLTLLLSFVIATYAVGQWQKVSVDEENVKHVADFASKTLSSRLNSAYHARLVHIHEAERQVVAGTNYKVKLTLGITKCAKNRVPYDQVHNCEFQDGLYRICDVQVYRNFDNGYKLTSFDCRYDHYDEGTVNEHAERSMFEDFIEQFGKNYKDPNEKESRFRIFQSSLKKIKLLNVHERGTAKYGVTKFADLTVEEFKKHALGFRLDLLQADENPPMAEIPYDPIPESFDWREKGVVSEVKNQGQCGSCWAFSTTGNIEGQWAIKTKKLVSLSEQELVDCDTLDQGCNGGLPSNAYKEIIRLGGLEGEKQYPYEGENEKCTFVKKDVLVDINGYVNISSNEDDMAQWLVKNGPISIGINANAMQFYFGGVSHPWKFLCDPSNLDHGVLIVGYGVHTYPIFKKTLPFWIIKNSWGPSWGEQGYYRVYRGDGTCGLNLMATSAVIN